MNRDRYINWYLFLFLYIYVSISLRPLKKRPTQICITQLVSVNGKKESYRNAKFEMKVQHLHVTCNTSHQGQLVLFHCGCLTFH